MTTMRLSPQTHARLSQVAQQDFNGATADEAIRRLLDEHWERTAVAAVERFRAEDPGGWARYLDDAAFADAGSAAPPVDGWDGPRG